MCHEHGSRNRNGHPILKPQEIHEVADWLQELREELWDKQIDADAKAGRLDKLMEEAKQDFLAGRCKPLNEILNKS